MRLNALMLNNNEITEVEYIGSLTALNTIVLSHNKIAALPSFPRLTDLIKLSATHNSITEIPDLSFNTKLKELRLSHNNIKTLPESLKECNALEVFEVGHNEIENWSDIEVLSSLKNLHNLGLKGNPICSRADYNRDKVVSLVSSLRILDGDRFDPKYLEIKSKRAQFLKAQEAIKKRIEKKKEKNERLAKQKNDSDEGKADHGTEDRSDSMGGNKNTEYGEGKNKNDDLGDDKGDMRKRVKIEKEKYIKEKHKSSKHKRESEDDVNAKRVKKSNPPENSTVSRKEGVTEDQAEMHSLASKLDLPKATSPIIEPPTSSASDVLGSVNVTGVVAVKDFSDKRSKEKKVHAFDVEVWERILRESESGGIGNGGDGKSAWD
ncbi:3131_t:CDS:2 [Paraglomus occultum]|uniref:3131_t:CDS:1 n=1 Tax=Paraglomus occultum TaxID=144539 RepID=A0A9N8WAW4_9GLOM|nr:3131_t:CDS:2 [Paraglomus occultum]